MRQKGDKMSSVSNTLLGPFIRVKKASRPSPPLLYFTNSLPLVFFLRNWERVMQQKRAESPFSNTGKGEEEHNSSCLIPPPPSSLFLWCLPAAAVVRILSLSLPLLFLFPCSTKKETKAEREKRRLHLIQPSLSFPSFLSIHDSPGPTSNFPFIHAFLPNLILNVRNFKKPQNEKYVLYQWFCSEMWHGKKCPIVKFVHLSHGR